MTTQRNTDNVMYRQKSNLVALTRSIDEFRVRRKGFRSRRLLVDETRPPSSLPYAADRKRDDLLDGWGVGYRSVSR